MKHNIFIVFMLFLVVLVVANYPYRSPLKAYPFLSGADTLGSITNVDTVEWQLGHSDLNATGAWIQEGTYITAANKSSEQTVIYHLSNNSSWGYGEQLRVRIVSPAGTLTSGWLYIGDRLGALSLFVQPDTVTSPDSTIYKVRLQGQ